MPAHVHTAQKLVKLVEIAAKRSGVTDADAEQIARTAVEMIVDEYGSRVLYIPAHELRKRARREAIEADIRAGVPTNRLCSKWSISRSYASRLRTALG